MKLEEPQTIQELPKNDQQMIIDRVRRLGVASSDAILDPACMIFTVPDVDGLIGYKIFSSCAIVYGDPLCQKEDLERFVHAFHDHCTEKGLNIIYMTVTEPFAKWAIGRVCETLIEFGEELIIDPHTDPKARTGTHASLVRRKVRHALKEGTTVHEYVPYDAKIEKQLNSVRAAWLNARSGPQIHTSNIYLFANRPGKRWFYASHNNAIVAVLVLHQIQQRQGWLLNDLMHTPNAPHGTPELLVTSALDELAKEGCRFVTFGPVPAKDLGEIVGLTPLSAWCAKSFFWFARKIFRLDGRKKFWEKFHPESERSFLLLQQPSIGAKEIKALMSALHASLPD